MGKDIPQDPNKARLMNPTMTPPTTEFTFVVRFRHEWSGAAMSWRGRIEHVRSGPMGPP